MDTASAVNMNADPYVDMDLVVVLNADVVAVVRLDAHPSPGGGA